MESQAEMPSVQKGFLLMELLCSLVLLVISSLIIAAYWNTVAGAYRQATKKLYALQEIKNLCDDLLLKPSSSMSIPEHEDFFISHVSTPLVLTSTDDKSFIEAEQLRIVLNWKDHGEKKEVVFGSIGPKQ